MTTNIQAKTLAFSKIANKVPKIVGEHLTYRHSVKEPFCHFGYDVLSVRTQEFALLYNVERSLRDRKMD